MLDMCFVKGREACLKNSLTNIRNRKAIGPNRYKHWAKLRYKRAPRRLYCS